MSRRRASSPIGTGASPPWTASSTSALTAYGDLEVIESIAAKELYEFASRGPSPRRGS